VFVSLVVGLMVSEHPDACLFLVPRFTIVIPNGHEMLWITRSVFAIAYSEQMFYYCASSRPITRRRIE